MSINDVWRNIDKHLGVYLSKTFDQIPESSGVYSWFYPLRVTTHDLRELITELSKVAEYDALSDSRPSSQNDLDFNWTTSTITLEQSVKLKSIPESVYSAWDELVNDENQFNQVRKALMSASLLMPPLYIGKAKILRRRCAQHVHENDEDLTGFRRRFETFAESEGFTTKKVKDLIFVCIQTGNYETSDGYDNAFVNPHSVVEEILKAVSKPPYGRL